MISRAFASLVTRTATGDYSLSAHTGLLEPHHCLNQAGINRLVETAMASYGYRSRKAAMDDIFEISAGAGVWPGEPAASVNLLRAAIGDIVLIGDAAGGSLRLLCIAPARLSVLADTASQLVYGDILRPLVAVVAVGGEAIFAVERRGFPYPSDTRYYRMVQVDRIEVVRNDGTDIFADAGDAGRVVPHVAKTTVYATRGNIAVHGFDAEDFVEDSQEALFRIDFVPDGITYIFNQDFRINYGNLVPDERRAMHDHCMAELLRMCELDGSMAPLHRIAPLAPGTLQLQRRKDGFATLVVDSPAKIKSL